MSDMGSLKDYEKKRKFDETPEPKPDNQPPKEHLIFVIHKHAARALHYDLRLELEGVLKSWAVPKGPTLDPKVKRLALMVEDHPFDYKDFEGLIPEGNYGAGSVIIWDKGTYHHPSAVGPEEGEKLLREGLKKGDFKFVLEGEKVRGEFALVKTGKDGNSWLLIKKKDRFATGEDILGLNLSVESHRSLEDISGEAPKEAFRRKKVSQIRARETQEGDVLRGAPAGPMPHLVKPMLATLIKEPFNNPDWLFEIKWDGYRAIAEIKGGNVSLYSRNLLSLGKKFSPVVDSLKLLRFEAVLDGEVVAVDEDGRPDFQMLQDFQKTGKGHLIYYLFDILYFEGRDLTRLPLLKRKEILKKILPPDPRLRFSDHVKEEGVLFFGLIKEKGIEGMMAKDSRSMYIQGRRSKQWLKVKARLTEDAVIAGFTEPRGMRKNLGALVLGVYEGDKLVFIGHAGGGFDTKTLREMRGRLDPLVQEACPLSEKPRTNMPVTWVKPELVAEVTFHGWTNEGYMRQPVFLRLREDKPAREVVREIPVAPEGTPEGTPEIPITPEDEPEEKV
ncbi:MAG TPA: non-homologous end-joining DNA ligase [Syntrophorhabdaceae bacterium]|jgi:bifunctional non-homologous end joining protein LigD